MRRLIAGTLVLASTIGLGWAPAFGHPTQGRSYPPGWNLVSGPTGAHIVGAVGPLYTLRPGDTAYESVPNGSALERCVGYWAYFPAAGGGLQPGSLGGGSCTLTLAAGQWALLGNPTITLAPVSGATQILSFDGTKYQPATTVDPGGAVLVLGPGTVQELPPSTPGQDPGAGQ